MGKGFNRVILTYVSPIHCGCGLICHSSLLSTFHSNCLGLFNTLHSKSYCALDTIHIMGWSRIWGVSTDYSFLSFSPYCSSVHRSPSTCISWLTDAHNQIIESWNHLITEWFGLEETSMTIQFQPPFQEQDCMAPSNLTLNTSRDKILHTVALIYDFGSAESCYLVLELLWK